MTWAETFDGFLERKELRIAHDPVTGRIRDFRDLARLDRIEWVPASGAARLVSFVIYHRQYDPRFPAPYNVALVELAEGPRLISTILPAPETLVVGMALQAAFDAQDRLVFAPVTAA
jgi:hypothetical protein